MTCEYPNSSLLRHAILSSQRTSVISPYYDLKSSRRLQMFAQVCIKYQFSMFITHLIILKVIPQLYICNHLSKYQAFSRCTLIYFRPSR